MSLTQLARRLGKTVPSVKEIVMRTSRSMKFEQQENSSERIALAIKERAESLKNEMPKFLWD